MSLRENPCNNTGRGFLKPIDQSPTLRFLRQAKPRISLWLEDKLDDCYTHNSPFINKIIEGLYDFLYYRYGLLPERLRSIDEYYMIDLGHNITQMNSRYLNFENNKSTPFMDKVGLSLSEIYRAAKVQRKRGSSLYTHYIANITLITTLLSSFSQRRSFLISDDSILSNSAASAVPLAAVAKATIVALLLYCPYSGRTSSSGEQISSRSGKDPKSEAYAKLVNEARRTIEQFVALDSEKDTVLYTMNTSDSVGKHALMCNYKKEDIILIPRMEHTSNFLPWHLKSGATVVTIRTDAHGTISVQDLKEKLDLYSGRVKLVAFTAASNIIPVIPPIEEITAIAHEYGAMVAVDCAQYAPHFPMNKKGWGADFLYFSGHKLGAPSGPGVFVTPKKWLEEKNPIIAGGGTVQDIVNENDAILSIWAPEEGKHQPGSWNTVGIIQLAAAADVLMNGIGWDSILKTEHSLLIYAIERLSKIPGFTPLPIPRENYQQGYLTPLISFNIDGYSADQVIEYLSSNRIQARGGTNDPICNHDYVRNILGLSGIVRLSFSYHNTKEEIDRIVEVLSGLSNKTLSSNPI